MNRCYDLPRVMTITICKGGTENMDFNRGIRRLKKAALPLSKFDPLDLTNEELLQIVRTGAIEIVDEQIAKEGRKLTAEARQAEIDLLTSWLCTPIGLYWQRHVN
jgi:hypothetical protein